MSRERLPEKDVEADEYELPEELDPIVAEAAERGEDAEARYELVATRMLRALAPNPVFERDSRLLPREERAILEIFEAARGHDDGGRHISAGVRLTRLNRGLALLRPLLATGRTARNQRFRELNEELEGAVKRLRDELKQRIGVEGVSFDELDANKPEEPDDDDSDDNNN